MPCDSEMLNRSRTSLLAIANAAEYTHVLYATARCLETLPVLERLIEGTAQTNRVVGLKNELAFGSAGQSEQEVSAWGKVLKAVGHLDKIKKLTLIGKHGRANHALLENSVSSLNLLMDLFIRLSELRALNLENNTALVQIDLRGNQFTQSPRFDKNINVVTLSLFNNQLTESPTLDKNTQLVELHLAGNQLTQSPHIDKNLQLQRLRLYNNRLTQIPNLDKLTVLTELSLQSNQLAQIPSLDKNTNLKHLWLQNNRLVQIPNLEKNTNLKHLWLQNNRLAKIPNLEKNTALEWVSMDSNQLTECPNLAKNSALTSVSLNSNRLMQSPNLGKNTALTYLHLNSNKLTTIPAVVNRLPNLEYLDLSDNGIQSLDSLIEAAATGGGAMSSLEGRNKTLLLLGGNPVCANGTSGLTNTVGSSGELGAKWFASCQSQCSSTCPKSIPWKPAGVEDLRGDGRCDIGCNTAACSYDGGDCFVA